jgi:hypothetical protein
MPPTEGVTLPPLDDEVELEPDPLLDAFHVEGALLPHPRVHTIAPATPMRPLIRES